MIQVVWGVTLHCWESGPGRVLTLMLMLLTLNLLTTTIVAPPSNASKWQMGFNSAFKGMHENQQIHQLFIQFINYVWYLLYVSALHCHLQGAFLVPSERCSSGEQSIEYCGWACCV